MVRLFRENRMSVFESFRHACHGLRYAWRHERNFRIQAAIAVGVVIFSLGIGLKSWEITVILLLIFIVLTLELLNTVVERLLDAMQPRLSRYVEELKDLMAAGVLIASTVAVLIASIIFIPKIISS